MVDDIQSVRLVPAGSLFGQEPIRRDADIDAHPRPDLVRHALLDFVADLNHALRRDTGDVREVDDTLVDALHLDVRRVSLHDTDQIEVHMGVFGRISFQHDEVRADCQRLSAAHADLDTKGFGLVGRRDHAAFLG